MRGPMWIGTLVVVLVVGRGQGSEPLAREPCPDSCLKRWGPAGGWNPYGGGLLHWWNPCWFTRCGGPDDYCRKPLPRLCWPTRPCNCTGGTPAETNLRPTNDPRDGDKPH
jgi:hypothetical protein